MKLITFIIFLLAYNTAISAETIYVSELLELDMRKGTSTRHKIIKMLPSGAPLTLLEQNAATGYSKVKTENGTQGYILTRFTQKNPAARALLDQTNIELERLKAENKRISEALLALQSDHESNVANNSSVTTERNQLVREIQELRQTAGSAIQIKQQRDQLQERVVNIERENQQLKRETQALEDTSNQDWFLNGGIVAFFGIFFGLLIPKLSWQRRRSSWDSF